MTELYWVRASRLRTATDRVRVLRDGDQPGRVVNETDTKALESELNITPIRQYFYLGRTLEAFGGFAFAVKQGACAGAEVSPFDSGGLVRKIPPVCDLQHDEKRAYLTAATWDHSHLPKLLAAYPGVSADDCRRYLDTLSKPVATGPHQIWPQIPQATIWADNSDWRCWTWEARHPTLVPGGDSIVAWTCEPALAESVLDRIVSVVIEGDETWAAHLIDTYVGGGVGYLLDHLRSVQVPQ
jgi:hypothetical protein